MQGVILPRVPKTCYLKKHLERNLRVATLPINGGSSTSISTSFMPTSMEVISLVATRPRHTVGLHAKLPVLCFPAILISRLGEITKRHRKPHKAPEREY